METWQGICVGFELAFVNNRKFRLNFQVFNITYAKFFNML